VAAVKENGRDSWEIPGQPLSLSFTTLHSLSFPFSLFPWPQKDVPGEGKEKMGEKDKRSVRQWSLFLESNLESQTHAV
jgi:hypothetical protein